MSERRKHLEFLRKTAKDAIWSGDYERALTLYEDGLALARSWKDRELEDLFTCNRATTLLEMDRQDFDLSGLKGIRGYVEDSGEGRWTIKAAIDEAVPARTVAYRAAEDPR